MKNFLLTLLLFISLALIIACNNADHQKNSQKDNDFPGLLFKSSDEKLNEIFNWASNQALAYSFKDDPVGLWYEASLPGREAFCMRDVSHQALGAHFLGLEDFTRNMLYQFAKNISESKDWCSYWEINRYGNPAPVDYLNDDEFWYNLPANFDVLDCCYRMFIWSGDRDYLTDSVFINFYRRTIYDYVERWALNPGNIMSRPRLMNIHGELDPGRRFMLARGIPGYNEGDQGYRLGIDLLTTEYRAFISYALLQQYSGNYAEAQQFRGKAAEVHDLIDSEWWEKKSGTYYTHINKDGLLENNVNERIDLGTQHYMLYWDACTDSLKLNSVISHLVDNLPGESIGLIEYQSHLPEILYKHGMNDLAYNQLLYVYESERREYPEASFSVVGAIVNGLMGIELIANTPDLALTQGHYVDRYIRTLPGLIPGTAWAELKNIPVRANIISVRHEGLNKTILTNDSGPSLIWRAGFQGSYDHLIVNGEKIAANTEYYNNHQISWVRIIVGAGERIAVGVPD